MISKLGLKKYKEGKKNMEKKDINVLEQMQDMTVDLNSKVLIEKAEKDGVETMYKRDHKDYPAGRR